MLIAVLVSSVLLALGFAIYNIVSKELIFSSAGRESQFAFYAADSGAECALYWDYKHDAFATSSPLTEVQCGDKTVPLTRDYDVGNDIYTTTLSFSMGDSASSPCADVSVVRRHDPQRTTIESLGYNTCITSNLRRIERAIRAQY